MESDATIQVFSKQTIEEPNIHSRKISSPFNGTFNGKHGHNFASYVGNNSLSNASSEKVLDFLHKDPSNVNLISIGNIGKEESAKEREIVENINEEESNTEGSIS